MLANAGSDTSRPEAGQNTTISEALLEKLKPLIRTPGRISPLAIDTGFYSVALLPDGGCLLAGGDEEEEWQVITWKEVVAVASGGTYVLALKEDGTCSVVGSIYFLECDVSGWRNVVAIAAGEHHAVGILADGTCVATGNNKDGQCDVYGWNNVVSVTCGFAHTVALLSDGTCVATGNNNEGECNVYAWHDVVAVAAGDKHSVALLSDGTCVAAGDNDYGQCDVSEWHDVVAIAAGARHSVALLSDGTCVAVGDNGNGQRDVSEWHDVVAIAAGYSHSVALLSDGTCVVAGEDVRGEDKITRWRVFGDEAQLEARIELVRRLSLQALPSTSHKLEDKGADEEEDRRTIEEMVEEAMCSLDIDEEKARKIVAFEEEARKRVSERKESYSKWLAEIEAELVFADCHSGFISEELSRSTLEAISFCHLPVSDVYILDGAVVQMCDGDNVSEVIRSEEVEAIRFDTNSSRWTVEPPSFEEKIKALTYSSPLRDIRTNNSSSDTYIFGDPMTVGVISALEQQRAERRNAPTKLAAAKDEQRVLQALREKMDAAGDYCKDEVRLILVLSGGDTRFYTFSRETKKDSDVIESIQPTAIALPTFGVTEDLVRNVLRRKSSELLETRRLELARNNEQRKKYRDAVKYYRLAGQEEEACRLCSAEQECMEPSDDIWQEAQMLQEKASERERAAEDRKRRSIRLAIILAVVSAILLSCLAFFTFYNNREVPYTIKCVDSITGELLQSEELTAKVGTTVEAFSPYFSEYRCDSPGRQVLSLQGSTENEIVFEYTKEVPYYVRYVYKNEDIRPEIKRYGYVGDQYQITAPWVKGYQAVEKKLTITLADNNSNTLVFTYKKKSSAASDSASQNKSSVSTSNQGNYSSGSTSNEVAPEFVIR